MTAISRVVTFGEGLGVLRAHEIGSLAQLSTLAVGTGGAEGNVAIGLARLGVPVRWLGRIGDDSLGQRVVRELRAENVDVVAIVDVAAATGLIVKETPAPGRTIVHYYRKHSAGSRLDTADLAGLELRSSDLLHVTGITPALSASAAAAVDHALDSARHLGATVSFDVNHRSRLWPADPSELYRSIAARADVVFGGIDEMRMLAPDAGPAPVDVAQAVAELGPREVVVKLGDQGAVSWSDGTVLRELALPVDVVDTVGAGDAFVAGYLAERVSGRDAATRLLTGVRAGAAACRHPGDWEGLPFRSDLERSDSAEPVAR